MSISHSAYEGMVEALADKDQEIARLRATIEGAPHADDCIVNYSCDPCTCWKRQALEEKL